MSLVLLLLFYISPLLALHHNESHPHHEYHDVVFDPEGNYYLRWCSHPENETISFVAEVKTKGWVGFGISPNGGMKGSDVVIGWVSDNGTKYFHDAHALKSGKPVIDAHQDWTLDYAYENATHTVLKFSRHYMTCDDIDDLPIKKESQRIIWAYHPEDPQSFEQMPYHKKYSGSKVVHLLSDSHVHPNPDPTESVKYWDVTSNKFLIPNDSVNTYWSRIVKSPYIGKHHAIKFEPIIEKGYETLVRHVSLYLCYNTKDIPLENYVQSQGWSMYGHVPEVTKQCPTLYFLWYTGGESLILPKDAGFPIGDDQNMYFLFQIHYYNYELLNDKYDSSGIRIHLTTSLRTYDADTFTVGSVSNYRLIIPPKQLEYTIAGHCNTDCFKEIWDKPEIELFGSALYGRHLAYDIRVKHYRNHTELDDISRDQFYDFNFQELKHYDAKKSIKLGDQITVECKYNSLDKEKALLGGYSFDENEVCLASLMYYPSMKNTGACISQPTIGTVLTIAEVDEIWSYDDSTPTLIKTPLVYQNYTLAEHLKHKSEWNNELINKWQYLVRYGKHKAKCYCSNEQSKYLPYLIGYPVINNYFSYKKQHCD